MRTTRGHKLAGVSVIAFALVGSATASGAAQRATSSSATFEVNMTLTGAVKGSITFKVVELDTPCSGGTGLGSAGEDGVPSPTKVKFNGVSLQYAINNASYKGPGTYPTKDFANSSAAISADKASESDPFALANGTKATETMVWNKNGSGSFVFANWDNAETTRSLSGKFTWTCAS
jgi:hypothetical protein